MSDRLRQYVPPELLRKLENARTAAAMQGERRQVTMLFCDVEGSTAAAEGLDPEDWSEIINGAFEHLIAPVYRYEGTVARLMGDGILAFFGAPIAHEDDPQRAVLAALEMVAALEPYADEVERRWRNRKPSREIRLAVRVGINTGLVVVGEVGSDLRLEYTALGDAINLAARMEQTARPGTVQVAEPTHRLVAGSFEWEPLGETELKGKVEPVRTYRVLRPVPGAHGQRGIEGLDSPMVGRDPELAVLESVVTDLRRGRGQLCSVMGEAGMGKSRLVRELRARMPEIAPEVRWVEGRALSYQRSTPYAPIRSLLENCLGVRGDDPDAVKFESIRAAVERDVPDGDADTAAYLATLFDVELSGEVVDLVRFIEPPVLRERAFASARTYLTGVARREPVVAVLEDLHWADSTSMELIEQLMELTEVEPIVILGVFRPRREDAAWRFHERAAREFDHRYTAIELEPLDQGESMELVANLLEIEGLSDHIRDLILRKSEGNPFYVEEVIRSLIDSRVVARAGGTWRVVEEVDDIAVPDTLVSVLTTRLDALDDEAKLVAYTAAVIGREFDRSTLEGIVEGEPDIDMALSTLQRRGLVREVARIPEPTFTFKHGLTRQAAYEASLNATRRRLHVRLGELIEAHHPERIDDLAHHFAAGSDSRALPYLVEAGKKAFRQYSVVEAKRYFARAVELFGDEDPVTIGQKAYEGLGTAQMYEEHGDEALGTYEDLLEVGRRRDSAPTQVSAKNKMGLTRTMMGDTDTAKGLLQEAGHLAKEVDDRWGIAEYHVNSCLLHTALGELDEAGEHQQAAMTVFDDEIDGARDAEIDFAASYHRAYSYARYTNTLVRQTRYEQARDNIRTGLEYTKDAGHKEFHSVILGQALPVLQMRDGDIDGAFGSARAGYDLAHRIGKSFEASTAAGIAGDAAMLLGRWDAALSSYDDALESGRPSGMAIAFAGPLAATASIVQLMGGDPDRIRALRAEALHVLEMPLGTANAGATFAELGFGALGDGELDDAASFFRRGLDTDSYSRQLALPQNLLGLGFAHLEKGDVAAARAVIDEASDYVADRAMQHVMPLVELAHGHLAAAEDRPAEALDRLARGDELAEAVGMRPARVSILALSALVLDGLGRRTDAERRRSRALAVVEEMAGEIADEVRRGQYLDLQRARLSP